MKVLALYDHSGPKYHRILLPVTLMPGIEFEIAPNATEENCNGIDILFINRAANKTTLDEIIRLRELFGFKIILDLDDHWQLDRTHLLYEHYKQNNLTQLIELYIYEADAVTVTHKRLADQVKLLSTKIKGIENRERFLKKPVTILPNAIPYFGQFTAEKVDSEVTRLFWAGSATHQNDIEILLEPIKTFKDLPIKMVMGGYMKSSEFHRMRNVFTRYGKFDHLLIEGLPVESYYYAYSQCDISLIPLVDNSFNRYKSNLKILEAANIGSPVIVSKVHPYLDFPEHLVNYVSNKDDWLKHTKFLLQNPSAIKEQGEALKEYCTTNYNFEKININRLNLFNYVDN